MTTATRQEIVSTSSLFSILSHNDNLRIFVMAKDDLRITPSILDELEVTPKRYYRSLKQLKDAAVAFINLIYYDDLFHADFLMPRIEIIIIRIINNLILLFTQMT